jgi:branched-chain amino acid transport system permease protein
VIALLGWPATKLYATRIWASELRTFLILTVDGVTNGFVYAIVALALVMIWRATRVINYAQGAMGMFTTYVTLFAISHGVTYWLAFVIALGGGFLLGAAIERVLVRPIETRPPLNLVILTLGLLIFLEALAPMLFGGQVQSFPAPFSRIDLSIGSTQLYISPFDIFVIGAVVVTMVALLLFFQRTTIGLRMRAAAFGPEIARLLGVRVGRMLTLGWGLAALLGAMAGVLIAPAIFLYPNNMDEILVFGFIGAVLGGLESPVGAVVGALLVGLGLSYVGGYAGSDLQTIGGLVILIAVLMIRPQGLFATRRQREA